MNVPSDNRHCHLTPADRYLRDPEFHSLVEMIYAMIVKTQFTPTELREAVMFAAVLYESMNILPSYRYNEDGSVTVSDRRYRP